MAAPLRAKAEADLQQLAALPTRCSSIPYVSAGHRQHTTASVLDIAKQARQKRRQYWTSHSERVARQAEAASVPDSA
eukprot:1327726-Rhodomonas_salina.1